MKKSVKLAIVGAMVGVMAFAAGCGSDNKAGGAKKDVLKVGVTNFADSLEPTENFFSWVVMRYGIGETLVKFDDKMNATPWIAEKWSLSDDKMTWTFVINEKVKFSNGNKVTAEAVKKSIERTFEKSNRAKTFFTYESIEAKGQELIIKTTKPTPGLPGMLADPLFLIIDTTATRDIAKEGPIGTGPYMVKSYSKAKAVMEANPNYWDGEVPFKTVEIPTIDDANTRAMALQSGEIDMAVNISTGDMPLFQDKKDKFFVSEIPALRTVLAQLNQSEGHILKDMKVRQALISALDRPTYNKVLLRNAFLVGSAPVPPSLDYGFDQLKDENAYNIERAKKLLAEAGWKDTNGNGILDKDGKELTLNFVYYSGRAELPLYAEATQADAKKVGIDIKLQNVDYNVLDGMRQKGDFDLIISNIITANTGDPAVYLNWYWKTNINGSNPQNGTGYSNAMFDSLSDQLGTEFDPAKRRDLMIKMQEVVMQDAATVFFGYPKTNVVSNTSIVGAAIKPADYYWVTKDIKPAK